MLEASHHRRSATTAVVGAGQKGEQQHNRPQTVVFASSRWQLAPPHGPRWTSDRHQICAPPAPAAPPGLRAPRSSLRHSQSTEMHTKTAGNSPQHRSNAKNKKINGGRSAAAAPAPAPLRRTHRESFRVGRLRRRCGAQRKPTEAHAGAGWWRRGQARERGAAARPVDVRAAVIGQDDKATRTATQPCLQKNGAD